MKPQAASPQTSGGLTREEEQAEVIGIVIPGNSRFRVRASHAPE
jgi:hypothetical protein